VTAAISADLLAAYHATVVRIHDGNPVVLSIADPVGTHDGWLALRGKANAVIITAWNPFSQVQSQDRNDADNAILVAAIEEEQLTWVSTRGSGPSGEWFEDSFCVFDVPDALLDEWLVTFRQNAAFRVRVGEQVELVWNGRFCRT
jgi:Protein of unknown function (DUF3293)